MADPVHNTGSMVGLDTGVTKLATLSDATLYQSVNRFKQASASWQKQKRKIRRPHSHMANIWRDYLHKVTSEISKNHVMIVIEDLKLSNMSKSAKGTSEQHGCNVRAKSGLNRSIPDQEWYEMRRQPEYKQHWRGGQVIAPPAHTSQRCACCGHTPKDNRQSQSKFKCQICGDTANADVNGARNILAAGHAVLA